MPLICVSNDSDMKHDVLDKRSYAIFSRGLAILAVLLGLISLLIRNSPVPGHQMAFKLAFCSLWMLFGVMVWFRLEYLRDYKLDSYKAIHIRLKIVAGLLFIIGISSLFVW